MSPSALLTPGFVRFGPERPVLPVILSVPHAGRDYPAALLAAVRLPRAQIEMLEDRHADRLASGAIGMGATAFVATRARCWIDLNRDEREIDPAMIVPPPSSHAVLETAKVRGGLGLVPRRMAGAHDIWRGPITAADLAARIAHDHRPWHQAIDRALRAARQRFGMALLIDCHSMPPLAGENAPRIVIGDRHGGSADRKLVDRVIEIAHAAGHRAIRNAPYAGGHTLDRHGRPAHDIHAIQIEIDRRLYLAPDLLAPGPGMAQTTRLITDIVVALADMLGDSGLAEAAE